MPKLRDNQVPAYRLHKQSGRAIVTLNGRDVLLGRHGSAGSRTEYRRLTSEWLANGRQRVVDGPRLTVVEILARFLQHAQRYYAEAGGGGEVEKFRQAMRPLKRLYGLTPADTFGPLALQVVREAMIRPTEAARPGAATGMGWSRTYANQQVRRLKHIWKWATANELLPPSAYHALQSLAGIRRGKSEARETAPVKPVPEHVLADTLPRCSRTVRAMIDLQLLTAMRPGELVAIRPCDIDTAGKVWVYRPPSHKTQHHGHSREIRLGPRAQLLLRPFLPHDLSAHVFSPARAVAEALAARAAARTTPLSCGNTPGSNRRRKPKRHPGEAYTVASYRRAIERACRAAGVEPWHPHRLRHSAATRLRRDYGIEAARAILGHRSAAITEVYAEMDGTKAEAIMAEVG